MRGLSLLALTALVLAACVTPPQPRARTGFAAPPPEARVLNGGVAVLVQRPGTGSVHPDAGSIVRVEFTGYRADGSVFDSSKSKGKPQIYELPKVMRGLSEGIQQMVTGEASRLWIPASLAYGEAPEDARLPAGDLVFDVELLSIVRR